MYESRDDTTVCPNCAVSMDSISNSTARRTCPNCGELIKAAAHLPWANVARVSNLAEAGFLTDELVGLGIDAHVHQLDDFSALEDRWTTQYLIRVPVEAAHEAAAQIRCYFDEDVHNQKNDRPSDLSPLQTRVMDPVFWRPVALILLTGFTSFALGQRFSGQVANRMPPANSLPSTVHDIGRPFTTESAAGEPQYRLSFDSHRQAWLLDTDRDNDGQYDFRQQYHPSGAAW
jgi:hypothetical protein